MWLQKCEQQGRQARTCGCSNEEWLTTSRRTCFWCLDTSLRSMNFMATCNNPDVSETVLKLVKGLYDPNLPCAAVPHAPFRQSLCLALEQLRHMRPCPGFFALRTVRQAASKSHHYWHAPPLLLCAQLIFPSTGNTLHNRHLHTTGCPKKPCFAQCTSMARQSDCCPASACLLGRNSRGL